MYKIKISCYRLAMLCICFLGNAGRAIVLEKNDEKTLADMHQALVAQNHSKANACITLKKRLEDLPPTAPEDDKSKIKYAEIIHAIILSSHYIVTDESNILFSCDALKELILRVLNKNYIEYMILERLGHLHPRNWTKTPSSDEIESTYMLYLVRLHIVIVSKFFNMINTDASSSVFLSVLKAIQPSDRYGSEWRNCMRQILRNRESICNMCDDAQSLSDEFRQYAEVLGFIAKNRGHPNPDCRKHIFKDQSLVKLTDRMTEAMYEARIDAYQLLSELFNNPKIAEIKPLYEERSNAWLAKVQLIVNDAERQISYLESAASDQSDESKDSKIIKNMLQELEDIFNQKK